MPHVNDTHISSQCSYCGAQFKLGEFFEVHEEDPSLLFHDSCYDWWREENL